eukprot:366208-Chlamydomonas_euryale.AAC.4
MAHLSWHAWHTSAGMHGTPQLACMAHHSWHAWHTTVGTHGTPQLARMAHHTWHASHTSAGMHNASPALMVPRAAPQGGLRGIVALHACGYAWWTRQGWKEGGCREAASASVIQTEKRRQCSVAGAGESAPSACASSSAATAAAAASATARHSHIAADRMPESAHGGSRASAAGGGARSDASNSPNSERTDRAVLHRHLAADEAWPATHRALVASMNLRAGATADSTSSGLRAAAVFDVRALITTVRGTHDTHDERKSDARSCEDDHLTTSRR